MIPNDATSLDVIKYLITSQDLYNHEFYFAVHRAEINWRQTHADVLSKLAHVASAVHFSTHDLIPMPGREIVDSQSLHKLLSPDNPILSIASKVRAADGCSYHLPMMNLHLDIPITIDTLYNVLNTLIPVDFYLLRTDRYFHVYGTGLMTDHAWTEWNLKFLMADCLVSPRYIGHSLERGYNTLRTNATDSIKTIVPQLVPHTEASDEAIKYREAKVFAIIKHASQLTKGGEPYFRHLLDVENYTVDIAVEIGLPDREVSLMRQAAVLHDTIEDTDTDYEDLAELTGTTVADMVATLSNDKRRPKEERNEVFAKQIETAPLHVQAIKLADIYANLSSIHREVTAGAEINVDYLKRAGVFLSILERQLKDTTVFKRCKNLASVLTARQ